MGIWHERAEALKCDGRALINGERVWAQDGAVFMNTSPVDGRELGEVARCSGADVDLAVAAARTAFADRRWAGLAPAQRKKILQKFADLMGKHREELALLETMDMGKPIKYSQIVDVNSSANCIRWFAEAVDKIYDEIAPTPANSLALITREPVGVVAAIVPWNYPMLMASWKLAPALAAGNSIVLKPSEKSPLSALRLAETGLGGRDSTGGVQCFARFWSRSGQCAGAAYGCRLHCVYWLYPGWQADIPSMPGNPI